MVAPPLYARMLRALLLSFIALFVATCDRSPVSPSARSSLTPPLTTNDLGGDTTVVLVGAGDIVRCDSQEDEATAALLDNIPGIVFTVGDNVYAQSGIIPDFENCYGASWGRHKARTRPAHGHMEPWQPGSTNYYNYFGAAAGEPGKGYYSYDAGAWHVVVLNSDQPLAVGSPQDAWLNADLAARTKACLLAIWHHPLFSSSGSLPVNNLLKPAWEELYAAGASLVVNSHQNVYERFAPQRPDGSLDLDRGIRQFTVGTGGISFSGFRSPAMPNSEARNSNTHGVLKLTLRPDGYDWQFVPQAGKTFTDVGSGPCFGPTGNLPPVARPGGPYVAENALTFDGSTSSDPDGNLPLSFLWDFGDGATGSGPTPTHAYAAEGAYTVTLTVTDTRGGQGMATTTATIQGGPPTVDGGSDVRARSGRVTRLTFAFTDKDAYDGPWSYDVAWGDGAHSTGTTTTFGQLIEVSHVYGDAGQFTVPVAVTDKDSATGVDLVTITVSPPGTPEIIAGAGNIASCGGSDDEATAALLDGIPGLVFTLGDNAFPNGSAADYANCYHPSWGRHRDRTRAVQGNHEYHSPGGAPSFAYWGVRAGPAGLGYYSYDVADWHVIVLNDQIAYSTGSPQYQWLQADLAANTARCTIAMWHVPLFLSSNEAGYIENPSRRVLWNALYAAGVDIVLNAQQHHYERFAPQTPAGALDERGIREFNVGTGGESTVLPTVEIHPNSQVRSAAFGVLKVTLRDGSYSWEFVPVAGETFSDAGSGTCDGQAPNQAPTANAGGPYAADADVLFSGAGSSDPDNNLPLTYAWTFGDGTTGSGVSPTKTYTTNGTYTATLVVTDALGLASAPASTSVTIANIAPTVNAGADTTLELGAAFPLDASFTDPGDAADAPWGWTIAWGDGTSESGSAASPGGISASHSYTAAGSYTVQVSVTDKDGGTGVDQATVSVRDLPPPPNQAPTANPGGSYAADATVAFDGTGSSDPDNNLPLTYSWDFGDATTGSGATPSHTYATAGSYTVTLVVTDALGRASATVSTTVTIANVVPAVIAGADTSLVLGNPFQLNATFTDPGGAADAPWAWTIAWGDGATQTGSSASPGDISASHTYAAAGSYAVQVSVTDLDGGTGVDQATVTVPDPPPPPNQAPTANPGGSYAADATVAFDGTGSHDPDNNVPLTYAWDFGDATTGNGATPSHTYATAGSYTVTLVVTDALGLASAPAATTVTIANVAPAVNAGADASVVLGSPFSLSATFSDAGGTTDAPWAWTVAWGDGTTASGSTNALGGPIAASHNYAAPGAYTVQVTVTDKDGSAGADEAVVTVPQPATAAVIVGAGNSTRCDLTNDEQTALLLDGIAGTVFTTGDNVRASGSLTDFQNCYDPTWGRQRSRTRPAAGDLDYQTAGAAGYFTYFGAAAGTAGQGYYSYELGAWHIVVLNSNISMAVGSPQETWLRGDLAAHPTTCVLAYWHHPRFSSYSTAVRPEVKPLWDALYAAGADVVLNGHYRLYERFAPQTPTEVRDDAAGIRQFTVGTGGHGVEPFGTPRPNSQVRESGTYGVLKLTLRATSYDWEFVPIAGQAFTDSGTTACH